MKLRLFFLLAILPILSVLLGIFLLFSLQKRNNNSTQKQTILPHITTNPSANNQTDFPLQSVVAENLEVPWGLVFLPDGSMLITERPGRVRLIDKNSTLKNQPILTLSVVQKLQGEGGLLGITIHPDFEKNRYVYLYYAYETGGDRTLNRVARYTLHGETLTENKIIVDKIPGSLFHDGGRIKFGPDKLLYITTGDSQNPSLAQDKNSLAGKILRVTDDGKIPPDNPFGDQVYSYGHRNPQGITWDDKGQLWETEHGRSGALSGLDELNLIEKGKNYGWPEIQGDEKRAGMVTPVINSGPSTTWAPAGAAFLPAGRQGYNGSIFFGGLKGATLYEAVIKGTSVDLKKHFSGEFGRIRDVVLGPDNMLYITTSNKDGRGTPNAGDDKIIRINPEKL